MALWEAILLGIVQGLTEFLPISSTAHLLITRELLGHGEKSKDAFTTAIQMGTLVAVFIYFRADIARIGRAVIADTRAKRLGASTDSRLFWMMAVATIPVVICGLTMKDFIKGKLYSLPVIGAAAIGFALLLLAAEWRAHRRTGRGETEVTWFDAILVGLFQALALIPGASRSGVTITAGLFAGLSRPAAARLSFLLSLPAILGAGMKEMYDDRKELFESSANITNLVVGTAVAGVVGYFAISWLLGFLKRYSTMVFIVYRILLGGAILVLWLSGVIKG